MKRKYNIQNRKKPSITFSKLRASYNKSNAITSAPKVYSRRKIASSKPPVKSSYYAHLFTQVPQAYKVLDNEIYPTKGSGNDQRLGSDIMLKSLEIRYTFNYVYNNVNFNNVRISLIQFTGQNAEGEYPTTSGSAVSVGDLVYVPPNGSTTQPNLSLFNTQTKQEYRVLYDANHDIDYYNRKASGHIMITKFPITKLHFLVSNSSLSLPSLSSGLIVVLISGQADTGLASTTFQMTAKLNYTDT